MIKNILKEELEIMSYTDLTYHILKEEKKTMKTPEIFKAICQLLDYSDEYFVDNVGDYYTSLVLDKRFVLLENNEWDIRDNHSISLVLDDVEDEEETEDEETDEEEEFPTDDLEEILEDEVDDLDDLDEEDELEGLNIIPDEELEDN